jgi:endothelin-converting enzyme/putative endopeptidase
VSIEFDRRAECVEKQFDEYVAIDDLHVKGKLTLGENLADLGGIELAYEALQAQKASGPPSPFSVAQQFFIGFAQAWCAKYRPEALRLIVATNPHSPAKLRVNGPLSNLPQFASAFSCSAGSPMVRAKRCKVW